MKRKDKIQLKTGMLDRNAWLELWDRLPVRARPSVATFVLQQLHAIESGGQWGISWHFESSIEREESGAPIFEFDQSGDRITFRGSLQIGTVGEKTNDSESMVGVPYLGRLDWKKLRQLLPEVVDLGDKYEQYTNSELKRFADLAVAGLTPCRVLVDADEFLDWCAKNSREPDAESRDAFASEKFHNELSDHLDQQK